MLPKWLAHVTPMFLFYNRFGFLTFSEGIGFDIFWGYRNRRTLTLNVLNKYLLYISLSIWMKGIKTTRWIIILNVIWIFQITKFLFRLLFLPICHTACTYLLTLRTGNVSCSHNLDMTLFLSIFIFFMRRPFLILREAWRGPHYELKMASAKNGS